MVLYHLGLSLFQGGYLGVDLLFVVSGYLITQGLAAEIVEDRLSILEFCARRVRRIVPALVATLFLVWLSALFLLLPSDFVSLSDATSAAALSVANLYFSATLDYFADDTAMAPLLHSWSLSVEEQFYAVIPFGLLIAWKLAGRRWLFLIGPLCLLSFGVSAYAAGAAPTANFYWLPLRAWELGIGALVALAPPRAIGGRWAAELSGAAGLLLVALPIALCSDAAPLPGGNGLYPCLGAALLIHSGRCGGSLTCQLLASKPLVALGLISYSLYLVHWPLIVFTRYRTGAPLTEVQIIALVVASLVLAALSWRFVERPFRNRSAAGTPGRTLAAGVAAIAAASLLGAVGVAAKGFPARFPEFARVSIQGREQWRPGSCFLNKAAELGDWSPQACTLIATGPRKVLLWGDSFAAQYSPGIRADANSLMATVMQYSAAGCPPVLSYRSYARPWCADFNRHAIEIIRAEGIDTVILGARWTDLRPRGLDAIRSTLNALDGMGVRTIVIGQSPEFIEDVQVLAFFGRKDTDGSNHRSVVSFDPSINAELRAIVGAERFVDPMPPLCDGRTCLYEDDGAFLFQDYGHLSVAGSEREVRALLAGRL